MSEKFNNTLAEMLSEWAQSAFEASFKDADIKGVSAVVAANPDFGDYQCNAAMSLAKDLKMKPRDIAQAVVDQAKLPECIERLEVAGPGFINIYLKSDWLAEYLISMLKDGNMGVPAKGADKTVIMDYGSPNMTKPLHIGHLRSHNIGSVLDRLHRCAGYNVIADNHLGDWGTQFGITIMGYREYGDEQVMKDSPLEELERVYVKSYNRTKEDPEWLDKCRKELVRLQDGDEENLALWKEFMELSKKELERAYQRLGVSYDLVRGESYYHDKLAGVVELLREKGLSEESEGAEVVILEDEGLQVCIVRKGDGGFNYATTDLATVASRVEEFDPEKIIYITDERQQLHFKQIFSICRKLGYDVNLNHVWFGLMRMPDATISTREGNVIKLDGLLDEAETRALDIVRKSSPEMSEDQQIEVARVVGVGAVKYADLSQSPQSLVTFTWEKALALDGNSGPYLQYAYARIASVRDKYMERFPDGDPDKYAIEFTEPIERILAAKLARFPEVVLRATHSYKPNVLTDYLYELAQTYSSFHQNVPFLKAEEGVRESRIRLCSVVAGVLSKGMELLGVGVLERI